MEPCTLKQLQSYKFAAHDMLLYLDTHPDDKKAFSIITTTKEFNQKQNGCLL